MYFFGSVTSDFGTWLQNTAQVLLAYRLAHTAFAVGLVTCAQFSSPLVLGPWAGVMADRFGGRKTLLATQLVSALIAFALAVLESCGLLSEWTLVGGALASGLAFTFALPARNVIVRRLVPDEEARPAYIMDAVSYNLGRAVAPPLSVLLIATAGYGCVFAANGVTFLAFTMTLILARHGTIEPGVRSRVKDGFLIARREPAIMFLLLMVAAVTIADDPVLVLGPALASRLHVSADWSGWFITALGAGSVLGSLRRPRHLPTRQLAATALACLGVCMVCFVAFPWVWASFFAALGAGVTCLLANSMTRTLLSKEAGPKRAGSVMAVWAIAWTGSKPLASLTDGLSAGRFGVQATGVFFAIPAFLPLMYLIVKPYAQRLWTMCRRERPARQLALAPAPHRLALTTGHPLETTPLAGSAALPVATPAGMVILQLDHQGVFQSPELGRCVIAVDRQTLQERPISHQGLNGTDDNKAIGTHNQGVRPADLTTAMSSAVPVRRRHAERRVPWPSTTRGLPRSTATSTTTPALSREGTGS